MNSMELIGSILLVLAVALLVALFIARPFLRGGPAAHKRALAEVERSEHERSSLLAERDRVLTALQELDFDFALGKVPEDEYPAMRGDLLRTGAEVLRRLEVYEESTGAAGSAEERIEAAISEVAAGSGDPVGSGNPVRSPVAARAGTAQAATGANGAARRGADPVEDLIAARKRARQESAAGFCPKCGKPVQKSDKFCSKCGKVL